MTGDSNLGYLREVKQGFGYKQAKAADDFLIGILSTIVSEARKDAIQMAVRMARREAQPRRKIPSSVRR